MINVACACTVASWVPSNGPDQQFLTDVANGVPIRTSFSLLQRLQTLVPSVARLIIDLNV
jgi:hypothetical protein